MILYVRPILIKKFHANRSSLCAVPGSTFIRRGADPQSKIDFRPELMTHCGLDSTWRSLPVLETVLFSRTSVYHLYHLQEEHIPQARFK